MKTDQRGFDMNISEIVFEMTITSAYTKSKKIIVVPMFCSEESVMVEKEINDYITLKTYRLTPEIVEQVKSFINSNNLAYEIGKPAPVSASGRKIPVSQKLTVRFEDDREYSVCSGIVEELRKLLIGADRRER